MKTNLHLTKAIFFTLFIALFSTKAYSQDAVPQTVPKAIADVAKEAKTPSIPKSIRKKFRLGEILFAEIAKYDNSKVIIMNPEGIKQLDGVASIVFKLNKGRSIGLCDYVLEDSKGRQYPSVALKIDDGVFDGSVWEAIKDGEHKYSLLFFVNYPPDNSKQSYKLKYVLLKDIKDEHDLELINIVNENFTKPSVIDETIEIAAPPPNPTTPTPAPETVKPPAENKDQQNNPPPPGATPAVPATPVTPSPTTGGAPAGATPPAATGSPPAPSPADGK